MIEIHTMKFNYEIPYRENYKQNVHHWSEEHYTGRFLGKRKSYTPDYPGWMVIPTGHTHKLIVGYSDK